MSLSYNSPKDSFNYPIAKNDKRLIYYDFTNKNGLKEIEGKITVMPWIEKNQRFSAYISGLSGSGKTTFAVELIKKIKKIDKGPWALITSSDIPDPAFTKMGMDVYSPDYLFENEIGVQDFYDKDEDDVPMKLNLLFDDYLNNSSKLIDEYINRLCINILELTRKVGINIIVLNHKTRQGALTDKIIDECNVICMSMINMPQVENFAKLRLNYNSKQVAKIHRLPSSRHSFISFVKIPNLVICENVI
jgi:hypothetical protein